MILVTGGAGFIGSAIVRALNDSGHFDIVVVDQLGSDGKWKNLQNKRISHFVHKDQCFSWLKRNELEVEAIFHMGACSSTTETNCDYLMENNVMFSKKLFEYSVLNSIPFIYASSAATYGTRENNFLDSNQLIKEPLKPVNPYGYSKQVFDHWVISQSNFPPFWAGLKFFNVYGPNEYHKGNQASVLFHAYNQVLANGSIKLFKSHRSDFKDGGQMRDFIYVKDVSDVCLHLLKHRSKISSGIYNVGTGTARSFYDLGKSIFKALGKSDNIQYIDMPIALRDQYQYYTEASMDKLIKEGGYTKPMTSLEDGAQDYVTNHLSKEDPYL